MNKKYVVGGIVVLAIGIFIGSMLAPRWGGMKGPGAMMATDSIDAHFIEEMIPHHQDAIVMADLAMQKSEHQEIKTLVQDIQRTQSQEIQTMKAWYKDWYGLDVPTSAHGGHGMQMGMMGNDTDMNRLISASSFDKAFIEEMIPHHQMAVMMAQMLERTTDRPEMKQLAQDIIEAQTREINAMRGWYRQWYSQ